MVYRDAEAAGPVQLLREALAGLGGLGLGPPAFLRARLAPARIPLSPRVMG